MANYRKTKKHGNTTITSSAGGSSSHSYSSGSKSHRVSNRHRAGRVITRTTTRIGDWIKVTQKTSPNHKSKSTSYKSKANSKPLTKKEIESLFNISMAAIVLPFVFVWYSMKYMTLFIFYFYKLGIQAALYIKKYIPKLSFLVRPILFIDNLFFGKLK
jgi:hypothetical protein